MNPVADCPKSMEYGPCGGVTADSGCEVDGRPCPFCVAAEPVMWPTQLQTAHCRAAPPVVVDFRPDPTMAWELAEAAETLRSAGAAALIGEHVDDPTPHEPRRVAAAVVDAGLATIATVTCRDRSERELAAEVDALVEAGVLFVHCVTGDHPAARLGLDRDVTFELDGTELASLAAGRGARVSVAESPASPPTRWRAQRLLSKQHAGARLAILNHAGSPQRLEEFAREARDLGVTMQLIAPVPVVTDRRSAASLARFPGLQLPPGLTDRILADTDPRAAGIAAAAELGAELLASATFAGINLSGAAADGGICARAEVMAQVATAAIS